MVTESPGFSQTGGFLAMPTPLGVPVRMTVPGRSVVLPLKNSIRAGTSKIMSEVFSSCIVTPLRIVRTTRAFGSGISSGVTRHGPMGRNVSKVFPRHHWLPPNRTCQSLALTSLAHV